jgi:hypothetical protein
MRAAIDRFEGKLAVLLVGDESMKLNIPLSLLLAASKVGDVLNITFERDPEATSLAKERVSGLMEKLKKKGQSKAGIIRGPK